MRYLLVTVWEKLGFCKFICGLFNDALSTSAQFDIKQQDKS